MSATISVPAAAAPGALQVRDFPAWLPSMLVKELRQGLRTRGFVGSLVVFQLIMAIAMMPVAIPDAWSGSAVSTSFFWSVVAVQLLLVGPSRALSGLQQEADARTLDLLLLTRLDAWGIVLGKWLSLIAQSALLMVAVLPYAFVRWFAGSVDLVVEAQGAAILFVLSAILTAGGLWASRVARVLRIVLVIVLIFFAQVLSSMLGSFFGFTMTPGPTLFALGGGVTTGATIGLVLVDAAVLTVFFLLNAARNIAPIAENHAPLGRLLALATLLPVPVTLAAGAVGAARGQLAFAGGFMLVVCGIELAAAAPVMARHWRPWVRRGPAGQVAGLFLLPGWESALWFAAAGAAEWTLCGAALPVGAGSGGLPAGHLAWIALMGLAAVAFPAVVVSYGRNLRFSRAAGYLGCLFIMGALAGVMLAWSSVAPKWAFLRSIAEVLPVSSFLLAFDLSNATTATFLIQGAFALGTLAVAFAQTRGFADQLSRYTAAERAGSAAAPPVDGR